MCSAEGRPRGGFFVAVDSDGCAFDSMEIKIRECFIPNIIRAWELHAVADAAGETAAFVNLYSRHRGINRFVALLQFFDLLPHHPDVRAGMYPPPDLVTLRELAAQVGSPDQEQVRAAALSRGDAGLQRIVRWNEQVNAAVAETAARVAPFPLVRESLSRLGGAADILVTSVAPQALLQQQWRGHDLESLVGALAGQEAGSKVTHLRVAGAYARSRRLMIGDAPADWAAARTREMAFYPILPGREAASWQLFYGEICDLFLQERYTPTVENHFIAEFLHLLPEQPDWHSLPAAAVR